MYYVQACDPILPGKPVLKKTRAKENPCSSQQNGIGQKMIASQRHQGPGVARGAITEAKYYHLHAIAATKGHRCTIQHEVRPEQLRARVQVNSLYPPSRLGTHTA